jgi:two-component system, NarL family, response regulator DesR
MGGVKVLLVDDEPMFLEALSALLERDDRIDVVGTASGEDAVELALAHRPDVALVDLGLPGIDGFELTRRLVEVESAPRVVALSGSADAERAREAGACGFLLKGGLYEEVAETIVAVSAEAREAGT